MGIFAFAVFQTIKFFTPFMQLYEVCITACTKICGSIINIENFTISLYCTKRLLLYSFSFQYILIGQ